MVFIPRQLVTNFKCIRNNALAALREISSELVKRAEGETSAEVHKGLADAGDSVVAMGVSTVLTCLGFTLNAHPMYRLIKSSRWVLPRGLLKPVEKSLKGLGKG